MSEEGSRWGINLKDVTCPRCGEKLPAVRVPHSVHQLLWGGWPCPRCGEKTDKRGRALEPEGERTE